MNGDAVRELWTSDMAVNGTTGPGNSYGLYVVRSDTKALLADGCDNARPNGAMELSFKRRPRRPRKNSSIVHSRYASEPSSQTTNQSVTYSSEGTGYSK